MTGNRLPVIGGQGGIPFGEPAMCNLLGLRLKIDATLPWFLVLVVGMNFLVSYHLPLLLQSGN